MVYNILRIVARIRGLLFPLQHAKSATWNSNKDSNMHSFSNFINSFPYKSDPLGGLLDYTDTPDSFYVKEKQSGRDCDDYAYQWAMWGKHNGYSYRVMLVTVDTNVIHMFTKAHFITILEKNSKWWLMNYEPYGAFNTFEDALAYMYRFDTYKDGFMCATSLEG